MGFKKIFFNSRWSILLTIFILILYSVKIESTDIEKRIIIEPSNIIIWEKLSTENNSEFAKSTNVGIRGAEIYDEDLYLGTRSIKKIENEWLLKRNSRIFQLIEMNDLNIGSSKNLKNDPITNINKNIRNIIRGDYDFSLRLLNNLLKLSLIIRAELSLGGEVWKYNYQNKNLTQIIGDNKQAFLSAGFGDKRNVEISVIKKFQDDLYFGTWNSPINGCELWSFNGTEFKSLVGKNALVRSGFNDSRNIAVWSIEEFKNYLYVGTMNFDLSQNGGCQIWRSLDGVHWNKVVDRGFRDLLPKNKQNVNNNYAWCFEVYNEYLYVGTFNTNSIFGLNNGGCQLWRTFDGINWEKVILPNGDGFGSCENYGIRQMVTYKNELFVGTATNLFQGYDNDIKGCEIWKFNGNNWTCVIGSSKNEQNEKDGFGSKYNRYIWSLVKTSYDQLWAGTFNIIINGNIKIGEGCEIWNYNGENWRPIIKNDIGEMGNGFGSIYNQGARPMIEYPKESGNVIVGTYSQDTFFNTTGGTEIWIRYNN